jgi:hypothetical protein
MVVSSAGLRPKSDCSGKAQKQRGRHKITNTQLSKGHFKEKEKSVTGPRWAPDTKTDWPTDCLLQINFNFKTALARPRSNSTVNSRPVLSSERALQNDKHAAV